MIFENDLDSKIQKIIIHRPKKQKRRGYLPLITNSNRDFSSSLKKRKKSKPR